MNTPINKKYYIIPVIYAAILALLFVLQFSGKSRLSETVGSLTITGTTRAGHSGNTWAVDSLNVEHPAVSFPFSRTHSLHVQTGMGRTVTAGIRECTVLDDEVILKFDEGITLTFAVETSGNTEKTLITPGLVGSEGIDSLSIPFLIDERLKADSPQKLPLLKIAAGDTDYFIRLSRNGNIDRDQSLLEIPVREGTAGTVALEAAESGMENPYAFWFSKRPGMTGRERYQGILEQYRETAFSGWTGTRFRGDGGWLYPTGQIGFLEETFLAAVSEAIYREDIEAFDSFIRTAAAGGNELGYRAAVYTGYLREAYETIQENDRAAIREITAALRSKDAEIFSRPGFLQLIVDRGPLSLLSQTYDVLEDVEIESLTPAEAVNLLALILEADDLLGEIPPQIARFRDAVELVVLPSIAILRSGLYLETEPGFSDTRTSLKAGYILESLGSSEGNETIAAVGRDLIATRLSAADDSGFIPSGVRLGPEEAEPGGTPLMTAEEVYSALFPDLVFPEWTSLRDIFGPGTWIFSGAPITGMNSGSDFLELQFTFPAGSSHYFIVQGIEDFQGIRLHDLDWRSDPNFEIYSTGYAYNGATNTLFVKLGQREDEPEEEVLVSF